ncbi:MAG: hypothetical protein RRZ84_02940 [Romboutsia sp.]
MKKIINLLSLILIINIFIFISLVFLNYNNTFNILPISYAKSSTDSNDNYNLILDILKDTNKNNLKKYAQYIDITFIEHIKNDTTDKVAFTLSLPQQLSFVAIYNKISEGKYEFYCTLDDLATIDNLYFYNNFLVVEQTDSTSSTDFTRRKFLEIFYYKNDTYISIFEKNLDSTKIIKKNSSKDSEIKEVEVSSIDFLNGEQTRILCVTTTTKYKENDYSLNPNNELIELDKKTNKTIYEWDEKNKNFYMVENINYK